MLGMKADGKHAHDILRLCLAGFLLCAMRMPPGKFENGIHDPPGLPKTGSGCFQEQGTVRQRACMREKGGDIFRNLRDSRLSHGVRGDADTRYDDVLLPLQRDPQRTQERLQQVGRRVRRGSHALEARLAHSP
jgi:hypothetical protein